MPNHTTYVLDAVDTMTEAADMGVSPESKAILKSIRKTYKSDVVTDAYELLSEPVRAILHKIMESK
jgi:hypothetical protein